MSNLVAGQPGLDPTLPDVQLILGGKVRQLCFDFNAIAQVEKATGINLLSATVSFPTFTTLAALLWASLLRHAPEITLDQVGALINTRNAPFVQAAVLSAWFGSTTDPQDVKGGAKGKPKARAQRQTKRSA